MPPRYAYWTILVDDQPTAFRAGSQEDLQPTFKRLKEKHPSAIMKWFQNGKLWDSRLDAQEAMRQRGERGRAGDVRQGGFRDRERRPFRDRTEGNPRAEWSPRGAPSKPAPARRPGDKLDWKPKGEFVPAPKRAERAPRSDERATTRPSAKPEWKPKGSFDRDRKPEWKPRGSSDRDRKPEWKPKGSLERERKPAWKPKSSGDRDRKPRGERLEWAPKGQGQRPGNSEKRKGIPKEEFKKPQAGDAKRTKNWRPGGDHKDPRQKYKDAKKAKWTRFKSNIRARWEAKQGKPSGAGPKPRPQHKKRRDDDE